MGKTVEELLNSISCKELGEWIEYNKIDPITKDRDDFMMGQWLAMYSNFKREKNSKSFTPFDFMPYAEKKKQPKQSLIKKLKDSFK